MSKVIFEFKGSSHSISCNKEDRMKRIAQTFADKVGVHLNFLCFLYGAKIIDLNLKYKEIASFYDKVRNQMNIIAIEKEKENIFICPYCGSNIESFNSFFDNLLSFNENIIYKLNEIKKKLEKIQNNNMIIEQIKIISDLFNNAIQEIKKNNFQNKEKLKNINKNNSIKDNIIEVKTIKLNNNNNNNEMREILSYNSFEEIKVFSNDELIKQRNSGKQNYLNYNDIKDEYKLVFGNLFTNFSGLFQNCSDIIYIDLSVLILKI